MNRPSTHHEPIHSMAGTRMLPLRTSRPQSPVAKTVSVAMEHKTITSCRPAARSLSIRRATANCAVAILASVLLTGCVKGAHFDGGGLATALSWLDSHDEKTIVSDVRLWAYGPEAGRQAAATSAEQAATAPQALTASQSLGSLAADLHFNSAADLAATLIPLEEGSYTVLGAVNLTSPFSCSGTAEDIEFTLAPDAYNAVSQSSIATPSESAGPTHAFYGVTQVNISDRARITVAPVAIRRILSELTIIIEDAPSGAKLSGEVLDAAASFFPLCPDADGNYGLASERTMTVTIPETPQTTATTQTALVQTEMPQTALSQAPTSAKLLAATSPEALVSPTLRLMPTASGREFSHLRILLTTPAGEQFEFRIEAPLMRPSGKYIVNLKYDQMRPYMRLSVHNINDWTEGWIYNGEILDPTVASAELLAATSTPAPVRTKSIPCVKSRLVRTGAEENNRRAHEEAWCAQNSSRAHGNWSTGEWSQSSHGNSRTDVPQNVATVRDKQV